MKLKFSDLQTLMKETYTCFQGGKSSLMVELFYIIKFILCFQDFYYHDIHIHFVFDNHFLAHFCQILYPILQKGGICGTTRKPTSSGITRIGWAK